MAWNCGRKIMTIFMLVTNVIICIAGLTMIVFGLLALHDPDGFYEDILNANEEYKTNDNTLKAALKFAPWSLVIIGGLFTFMSFLACCGTGKKSVCMMFTYSVLLGLLVLSQIGVGIYALANGTDVPLVVLKTIWNGAGCEHYDDINHETGDVTCSAGRTCTPDLSVPSMNPVMKGKCNATAPRLFTSNCTSQKYRFALQKVFKCCGSHDGCDAAVDSTRYVHNATDQNTKEQQDPCLHKSKDYNLDGCYHIVPSLTKGGKPTAVGWGVIGFAAFEIISLLFAIKLLREFRTDPSGDMKTIT